MEATRKGGKGRTYHGARGRRRATDGRNAEEVEVGGGFERN